MSAASPDHKLGPLRPLRDEELVVIKRMLAGTPFEEALVGQLSAIKVKDMSDGGMGSIKFHIGRSRSKLEYGKEISEAEFQDADGVPVSLSLSIDKAGDLFELDVWKVDFSPLIRYPDAKDVEIVERHPQLGFPPAKS
jgi:hypothetical protein